MLRLKNNTGATSLIGRVVILDPKDKGAYIYAGADATTAIGVVSESVPFRSVGNVAVSGENAMVYLTEIVNEGDMVRLRTTSDGGSVATCRKVRSTDGDILIIGSALKRGNGLILCSLNVRAMMGGHVAWTDITGTPTTVAGYGITDALGTTFETISSNLGNYNYTLTYAGGDLSYITYDLGGASTIIKTLNYTLGTLTSIVLSGDTPAGIDLTKTLSYTGTDLTGVAYS